MVFDFPINSDQWDDLESGLLYINTKSQEFIIKRMSNKSNALKRIQKDLEKVAREDDPGLIVNPDEQNLYNITAFIAGPEGTIWEGGIFELCLTFTD